MSATGAGAATDTGTVSGLLLIPVLFLQNLKLVNMSVLGMLS